MKITNELKVAFQTLLSHEEVIKKLGVVIGNPDGMYAELDGTIYSKNGNSVWPLGETLAQRESEFKKNTYEDEIIKVMADGGSFVINGLHVSNGYGDGLFDVVIRTFTNDSGIFYGRCTSLSEIYHRKTFDASPEGKPISVLKYDCDDNSSFELHDVDMLYVCNKRLYIIKNFDKLYLHN